MTAKPKVAVLLSGKEPFSPYYGGALARWTYEVYRRLESSVDVQVFGFPTPAEHRYALPHFASPLSPAFTLVSKLPGLRRYEDSWWLRSLSLRLRRFDVVHIHNRPQWVGCLRELGFGGTILLHLQNDHLGHWTPGMLDELARNVDAVVVCSSYLGNTFAAKCSSIALKTRVIFNGVDMEIFKPHEEVRGLDTVFFVGRIDREKGVLELVRAFANVLESRPKARLLIGGATAFGHHQQTRYVRELQRLAEPLLKTGSIKFAGYLDHDRDLPGYFQRATVFACPSLFQEPFGLVNAEALACATPVVGSSRGGIPEVIADCGRLINPEDTQAFAQELLSLLSYPAERERLGRAGRERARSLFDWQVIAQHWMELLAQFVATGSYHRSQTQVAT